MDLKMSDTDLNKNPPIGRPIWIGIFSVYWMCLAPKLIQGWVCLVADIILIISLWKLWGYFWKKWNPSETKREYFHSFLWALAGLLFIASAIYTSTQDSYMDYEHHVRTRDGYEGYGDLIKYDGPDTTWIYTSLIFAGICIKFAYDNFKKNNKDE